MVDHKKIIVNSDTRLHTTSRELTCFIANETTALVEDRRKSDR